MLRCYRCDKSLLVGMNVSHSHVRTKKRSLPNLHAMKIVEGGTSKRVRLCTKCMRIVKAIQSSTPKAKVEEKAALPA